MTLSESTGGGPTDSNESASDIAAGHGGAQDGQAASPEPEYGLPSGLWRGTGETLARTRRFYGANPLHLLVLLACFALAAYADVRTVG